MKYFLHILTAIAFTLSTSSIVAQTTGPSAGEPVEEQPSETPAEQQPNEIPAEDPVEEEPVEEEDSAERPDDSGPPEHAQGRGNRPDLPDAIQDVQDERRALQEQLVASRDALIEDLEQAGRTEEEIDVELDAWRQEHAADFDTLQDLRRQIREEVQEHRPSRQERGGPSAEVMQRREAFKQAAAEIREGRQELGKKMAEAESAEDRRAIIDEFKAKMQEDLQEAKELRRAERRGGNNKSGGDRRPE